MRVKVLRPLWFEGKARAVGDEIDYPDHLVSELIFGGKAERVTPSAKPAKPAQPEQEAATAVTKQPMTTKSAPALTGKKGE